MTTPQPQEDRVGYALLGLGELTLEELIPALLTSERSRLAALVTDDPEKGAAFARAYGLTEADVYTYDDFERLGERDDVQAVYIVLPNSLHREYTERAAKIGKHVLCEKPLADSVEAAEAMVSACKNAGVLLMTAYRCQYTPHHWALREAAQGGRLGAVKLIDTANGQSEKNEGQWRLKRKLAGGGSLPDVGLYCLNTARFVTGEEPYEVFAYSHSTPNDPRFTEVEETVSFILRFPSGVIANCLTSYGTRISRYLRVMGETGFGHMDPAYDYEGLQLDIGLGDRVERAVIPHYDQFALEIDHFSVCIREGRAPFTPGEEGLQDQRLMAALYRSAEEGRPVQVERLEGRDLFRGDRPEVPGRE